MPSTRSTARPCTCATTANFSPPTSPAPSPSSPAGNPTPPAAAPRLPPAAATARPASAPVAPLRTNTAAPPVSPPLPAASGVFFSPAISPKSPAHPRWDAAKATEIAVFDSIDCKTAISAHSVPAGQQIFYYLWRVTHKPNRGNGKPAERARYCIAGNRD